MAVKRKPKPLFFVVLVGFLGIILLTIGGVFVYFSTPVDKNDENVIEVVIPQGTTTKKIGSILKEKDLIKSELYFSLYTRFFNHNSLKASTYKLTKSMSLADIVTSLEKGSTYDPDALVLTFKEGKRITDYVKLIANNTSYSEDEIIELINDKTYLNELINDYWFLTSDILNKDIYYPLEGYLAPDTYFFNKDVDVKKIIETLLDEEEKNLNNYKSILENSSVHNYLTMASMAELEGKKLEDRKNIVGVFNNRIKTGISLGSDVTTYYALQLPMTEKLTLEQYNTINPYNTRPTSKAGLPVGPICNPSKESIEAAVNPNNNDYYYFVADKHGTVYFSKTAQEQNKVISELKSKGEWE